LIFHTTRLRGRKTRVISIPLLEITAVEVWEARWFGRKRAKLSVAVEPDGYGGPVEFRRIETVERAKEIARTIRRQTELLRTSAEVDP
jgi:hypothetical protein